MSKTLLTHNENRIVGLLKERTYGQSELCRALKDHMSPPTVRKNLRHLVSMELVQERKGRRGQKASYTSTDSLKTFEEKIRHFELLWEDSFSQLYQLEKRVKDGKLSYREAGLTLSWLVFEAAPSLGAAFLTGVSYSLSPELQEKLLNFSVGKFRSYWEEIFRVAHGHPEILDAFQKNADDIKRFVKPIDEKIKTALGERTTNKDRK